MNSQPNVCMFVVQRSPDATQIAVDRQNRVDRVRPDIAAQYRWKHDTLEYSIVGVLVTLNMREKSGFTDILVHSWTTVCKQIVFTVFDVKYSMVYWQKPQGRKQDKSLLFTRVCKMTPLLKSLLLFRKLLKPVPRVLFSSNFLQYFPSTYYFSFSSFCLKFYWATVCKTVHHMLLDRCLSCPVCLWRWCAVAKRLDGSRLNLACR